MKESSTVNECCHISQVPLEKGSPPEDDSAADKDKSSCSGEICRICFCGVSTESLLAPCQCKGSLAKVHKTCLETWLGSQAVDQCEICKHAYVTARRPKGFQEWLLNSNTREDKQNLVGDMVALLLLTPLVVFSLWLCTEGAIQFSHDGFPTWESAGLVFITVVLFVVFCVWVTLLYRYHYTIWKQWRSHNFHVNLLFKKNVPVENRSTRPIEAVQNTTIEMPLELQPPPKRKCADPLGKISGLQRATSEPTSIYHRSDLAKTPSKTTSSSTLIVGPPK